MNRVETSDWISWLDQEIDRAARAMEDRSSGASACTIHKDGRVTGGFKYQEGRMVALAEMRRLVRDDVVSPQAIESVEENWLREFDNRSSAGPSSPLWVAYATGGLEAAREARARLSVAGERPHRPDRHRAGGELG